MYRQHIDHHMAMDLHVPTPADQELEITMNAVKRLLSYLPQNIHAYFCTPSTGHIGSNRIDRGWGCGYRNAQMLISSCLVGSNHISNFHPHYIPNIPSIQKHIEKGWNVGFDPEGAGQLGHQLVGTNKWIGATEIATLLYSWRVSCKIIDFWKRTPMNGCQHSQMMQWISNYFKHDSQSGDRTITVTTKPPLYLQHQGHSMTVIGVEYKNNAVDALWVFDPMVKSFERQLQSSPWKFRVPVSQFSHKQYQIVAINTDVHGNVVYDSQEQYEFRKRGAYSAQRIP